MNTIIRNLDFGDKDIQKKYVKGAEPMLYLRSRDVGVLMLHGFTATPYQFKDLRDFLMLKGITVFTPLMAGHGTEPIDLYKTSIDDWISSTDEAYQKLKSQVKKIVVIGNSFGGNLAFHLGVKNDNSLRGIVSLGTPIYLKYDKFIKFRAYTYGWVQKYYKKRRRHYITNFTESSEVIAYPIIPTKSLRNFLQFIKYFTIPGLKNVTTPSLIIHGDKDPVVHPRSVQYLHQHLRSKNKKVLWLDGKIHSLPNIDNKEALFEVIYSFIKESTENEDAI